MSRSVSLGVFKGKQIESCAVHRETRGTGGWDVHGTCESLVCEVGLGK